MYACVGRQVCAHGKYRVAFEFRHYSWDHDDFRTSVLRCGITMVSVRPTLPELDECSA